MFIFAKSTSYSHMWIVTLHERNVGVSSLTHDDKRKPNCDTVAIHVHTIPFVLVSCETEVRMRTRRVLLIKNAREKLHHSNR
jgi:hypothetical protein